MYKANLIEKVATKTDMPKKAVEEIVSATLQEIMDTVASGDSVQIKGFGTFKLTTHAARTCHNPKTGEAIEVPEKFAVNFKAGTAFKNTLN